MILLPNMKFQLDAFQKISSKCSSNADLVLNVEQGLQISGAGVLKMDFGERSVRLTVRMSFNKTDVENAPYLVSSRLFSKTTTDKDGFPSVLQDQKAK